MENCRFYKPQKIIAYIKVELSKKQIKTEA